MTVTPLQALRQLEDLFTCSFVIKALIDLIKDAQPVYNSSPVPITHTTSAEGVLVFPHENDKLLPWGTAGEAYANWRNRDR
ncbi:hypothetical protein TRAPUB_5623 [Trametes pubescens]|uniref:Uncharacterized protein n=1 Tax=Trametes pubescens TaxID=154538 RepID=A0A1M2V7Z0_TRAPU|nr:hypothetical protein TRAPUB_5623 [Trametes pubescens]